jgi:acetoin utilization deacetylase AcuC-like enzyme
MALDDTVTQKTDRIPSATSGVGVVSDTSYAGHNPGASHPESPQRCRAAAGGIHAGLRESEIVQIPARLASDSELGLVHSADYIESVRRDVSGHSEVLTCGDTEVSAESFTCAKLAVGGVLSAADAVAGGLVSKAFCAVRPPGHHAFPSAGTGFCVFNNVALAARHLQKRHGLRRVLIVDWDVHHGNGTQSIFYDDPTVLYFSTHRWPWYPGTGRKGERGDGPGWGYTLNCPQPFGAGYREIEDAFRAVLVPAAKRFRADCVLVSAGFDSRLGDPLGGFTLSDEDFASLTRIVCDIAADSAEGRVLSILEGGYSLDGLGKAIAAHVKALAGR